MSEDLYMIEMEQLEEELFKQEITREDFIKSLVKKFGFTSQEADYHADSQP